MITARFKRPLHMLPEGELAFTLRLQRRASADNAPDHETMLGQNDLLVRRCLTLGGKIYPPFAPVLSREDWQRHYGPQLWERFAAARRHLDPNGVLTPGAGCSARDFSFACVADPPCWCPGVLCVPSTALG